MMTSSNGNILRVTGPLCGKFTGPRWIPRTKASDADKRLSKQWWGWWCESQSLSSWRHCNGKSVISELSLQNIAWALTVKFFSNVCHRTWLMNIGSGNGLVTSSSKPLAKPIFTEISFVTWRHKASKSYIHSVATIVLATFWLRLYKRRKGNIIIIVINSLDPN